MLIFLFCCKIDHTFFYEKLLLIHLSSYNLYRAIGYWQGLNLWFLWFLSWLFNKYSWILFSNNIIRLWDSLWALNWVKRSLKKPISLTKTHSFIDQIFAFILASSGSCDSLGVESIYLELRELLRGQRRDVRWLLQIAQNGSLRTALGWVNKSGVDFKKSGVDFLHAEAKCMPVQAHCEMLSKQFLLATTKPNHRKPLRVMVDTSQLEVRPLVPGGTIDDINYREGLITLHTSSVQETVRWQAEYLVLVTPAPKIHPSEKALPRKAKVTLAQLRSGHSSALNSFPINPAKYTYHCPKCGHSQVRTDFPHNQPPVQLPSRPNRDDP